MTKLVFNGQLYIPSIKDYNRPTILDGIYNLFGKDFYNDNNIENLGNNKVDIQNFPLDIDSNTLNYIFFTTINRVDKFKEFENKYALDISYRVENKVIRLKLYFTSLLEDNTLYTIFKNILEDTKYKKSFMKKYNIVEKSDKNDKNLKKNNTKSFNFPTYSEKLNKNKISDKDLVILDYFKIIEDDDFDTKIFKFLNYLEQLKEFERITDEEIEKYKNKIFKDNSDILSKKYTLLKKD